MDGAWALHRAHVLARRVALLHGVDPSTFLRPPTWRELLDGLRAELLYVEDHPEHAAFGVLNACRIASSAINRDVVVSKWASAAWATGQQPRWREGVEAALRRYTGTARPGDAERLAAARAAIVPWASEALRL